MVLVLERISIENYKCLVDFDLRLQDITLLVGANGAGKTAVLDVIYGLRKLLAGEAKITDPVAFPPSTLTRWQSHGHQQFRLRVRGGGGGARTLFTSSGLNTTQAVRSLG